jgi:hypothetical protein
MIGIELVDSEEVLKVVQNRGPLQPLEVRSVLKRGDSIVIGAALSELSSRKLVKVTHVKRGGSPFYYVSGQESRMEELSQWLGEKDKQTYEMLKKRKILRDSKQDPLTRVSLRELKDFAKQVIIKVNQQEEIFWRYFLVPDKEAVERIKGMFKPREPVVKREEPVVRREVPKEETQTALDETEPGNFLPDVQDEFLIRLKRFFRDKSIDVKEAKLNRKGSDYEFIIEMATAMGKAEYFCKAKGKKKCNDGDLSSAYLQGQMKRLPVVFVTTGEVAKKAKEKVSTDYKGMILKEI